MSPRARLAAFAALATALTATAVQSVFADSGWFLPTMGAIVVVFVGAEVGSRLGARLLFPALWRVVGGLAFLLAYACALDAPAAAWLGFVPTPDAVARLETLTTEAFSDIRTLAAPVPSHHGLVLVTLVGVGLVALAVDTLSPRAPLTGLPLLALYSVPEWLSPHGTGPIPFVLGAAGFLTLLVREGRERTARWGRTVGTTTGTALGRRTAEGSAAGAISAVGRRIGVAALGVALVVPPLVPGLDHPHYFGFGNGTGGGGHGGPVITFNPITRIYGDLNRGTPEPLLTYRTSSPDGTYLEFSTLDTFDNVGWSQSDLTRAGAAVDSLSPPAVLANPIRTKPFSVAVDVTDNLDIQWLPLPPDTKQVSNLSDQWSYDAASRTVFSPHSNTRGLRYDAQAVLPEPTRAALLASPMVDPSAASSAIAHYLALPAGVSSAVEAKAEALTEKYSSPYLKAWALQYFFTDSGGFVYDTHAPQGSNVDALASFVLQSKRGYCEQFATAMAAMARMIGIPARVAIGFTPGTRQGDQWVVTTEDAHAWPELYFQGVGWLRFEPTPRGGGGAEAPAWAVGPPVKPTQGGTAPGSNDSTPGGTDTAGGGVKNGKIPHNIDVGAGPVSVPPLVLGKHPQAKPISPRVLAAMAVGVALLLALAALPVARVVGRRRRHARASGAVARAHAAWQDVMSDAFDLGFRLPGSDSPRGAAARLNVAARLSDGATMALRRLAYAEERARYAPTPPEVGDIESDARQVRAALRRAVSRGARLRAALLPASTLHATGSALGSVTEWAFDAVDAVVSRGAAMVRSVARRPA